MIRIGFMYGQDSSVKDFDAYLERKCIPQLKELLTQYGKISIIWFDTPMEMTEAQSARLAELGTQLTARLPDQRTYWKRTWGLHDHRR